MASLTGSQITALQLMADHYGTSGVRFRTGEALLKKGLAERYTQRIVGADYVTCDTVTPQGWCSPDKPVDWHQWFITQEGRAALQEAGR